MLKVIPDDGILPTRLYCLNRNVDEENQHHLNLLPGPDFTYTGREHWKKRGSVQATGLYDTETEARERVAGMLDRTAPLQIRLRVGAQVMYMKNKPDLGLVNGSRGVVVSCTDASPTVKFDNGLQIAVAEEETAQGCAEGLLVRKFMPLKLAWAMTVHKSQGMTLTRVELQLDNAFEVGQVYVALSRVKSLEGLYIRGRNVTAALVCADREVLARFGHSAPGSAAPAGARRDNSASSSGADRKVPREWLEGPFSYSPVKAPEPTLPHPAPREAPAKFDAHMQFKDVPPPAPAVQPSNARPFVHPFTTGAARSAEPQVIDLISPPVPVKHEVQGAAGSSNSTRAVPSTSFFEQLVANNVRAAPPPAASTKPLTAKVEAIDLRSPTSVPAPVAQRNAAAAALMMPAAAKAAPPAAIPKAVLYFDGGSLGNPGVGGAGYLLYPDGQAAMGAPHLVNFAGVPCAAQAAVRMDGVCTNNQAEYTGLIHGLHCAALRGVRELTVYGDSELVVKQMRGEYKVKNPVLQEMKTRAAALADKFPKVTFHWIERAKNTKADELSKRAMCKRDTAEEAADWFVARK
jgi:ribonuclease HI